MHEKLHTGEKPFSCTQCDESFLRKSSLQRHEKLHADGKPLKKTEEDVTKNYFLVNENVEDDPLQKKYSCILCDYTSNNRPNIRLHVKSHIGLKPYKCTYCDMHFICNYSRKKHEMTHTGEKSHSCSYCNLAFARKSCLVLHERIHTGQGSIFYIFSTPTFGTEKVWIYLDERN